MNEAKPDDVVISGISGVFPGSKDMIELENNLRNKINLVQKVSGSSLAIGKIPNVAKFDASYFGLSPDYVDFMDPLGRILLEKSYETIIDAGLNPDSLRGKNVGVFVGIYMSETEVAYFSCANTSGLGITGITRCFLANRISYAFGLNGPSLCVDAACSSSMCALQLAYRAIQNNECEAAFVGGCNLCLNNAITAQLMKTGILSPDGLSKILDENANGYCRAEAICSIFLQKRQNARRIYAQVVHTKFNCDGYKVEGITHPSSEVQKRLLQEFYEECGIRPCDVDWLEMHATGTQVGDRAEIKAVELFCKNRNSALKVGSIKSNTGHTEATSGLCSIAKVIIAMRSGLIPPNINYKTPRNDIDTLNNGLIEVITENTPWSGGLVGINNFGLGGTNVHVLLKSFDKAKRNRGLPDDDLPRLVTISGRTEEAVEYFLSNLMSNPVDVECVSLLHDIHSENITRHLYRGYTILHKNSERITCKEVENCADGQRRPIWFVFAGMGSQWRAMGESLMSIPLFAKSIHECHRILENKNIDLIRILIDHDTTIFDNVLFSFVGITAMQIALIDVLRELNISPSGIVGHSAGEIACGYADNCLTREETILCAYYRGLTLLKYRTIDGCMAAVGLSYDELKIRLPEDIDIACVNSCNNCTISGPVDSVRNFIDKLEIDDVFAREINTSHVAFHSRYVKDIGPVLLKYLQKVIRKPRKRSEKWITTSVPKSDWQTEASIYCSPTYQMNNFINTVLFEDAIKMIPENAIVIEISPHSLLQAIIKPSLKLNTVYLSLITRQCIDSVECFLHSLGKLYTKGVTPKLKNLYTQVSYPVSVETRMLAPLVRWQHDRDWMVVFSSKDENMFPGERRVNVQTKIKEFSYLFDHVIDGRHILPGFCYVLLIWETLPLTFGRLQQECSIVLEKLRFHRIVNVQRERSINFLVNIQKVSGNFEVVENGQVVFSGKAYIPENADKEMLHIPQTDDANDDDRIQLNSDDIYKEFALRGFKYSGLFRQMISCNSKGTKAKVKWNDNWPAFLDNITQTRIFHSDARNPCLLTSIDKLIINLMKHEETLENVDQNEGIPVRFYRDLDLTVAGGVQIKGVRGHTTYRRKLQKEPLLMAHKFTPYVQCSKNWETKDFTDFCSSILWQNIVSHAIQIVEFGDGTATENLITPGICHKLNTYPHIQANGIIVIEKDVDEKLKEVPHVQIESKLNVDNVIHLIIVQEAIDEKKQNDVLSKLSDEGFVLFRLKIGQTPDFRSNDLIVCAEAILKNEKMVLTRRASNKSTDTIYLQITETYSDWIKPLQREMENFQNEIILYAQGESTNGILGLFNCLRREMPNRRLRCFFIADDNAPPFAPTDPFYVLQLSKNLNVNVLQQNLWGCYVHYPMDDLPPVSTAHAFVSLGYPGDLRTVNWYQGNIIPTLNGTNTSTDTKLIHVYYSALNFKDVLLATGALSLDGFARNRSPMECPIGFEFSGRDDSGRRYMGIYPAGAISTLLSVSKQFIWEIPKIWSLDDAATVPIAYMTVLSAFFVHGNLKRGESVLIHSAAGGVGQAAINVATFYNCDIFVTVGSQQKREFIRKLFPHISDSHIGNSRDTTFELLVMKETKGRGVDLVLNSLAEDKLQASVRCLAEGGRFLEIGKLDLLKDNTLGMKIFLRGVSFHCILLDRIHEEKEDKRNAILECFQRELKLGSVKPIIRTIFESDDVEKAFRYMAAGKHIGKVLIKIRPEESDLHSTPEILLKHAVPRFLCREDKVYVICGGLGGMGLEIIDWLMLRGARKVIVSSRNGIKTGYQSMRIDYWKTCAVDVFVNTDDISTHEGVTKLLQQAESIGPVSVIFNLATVIEDKLFENHDSESFESVVKPKAKISSLLNHISRKLCPALEHFVVFSSAACCYGNVAQSNYGYANSICERICEMRRKIGLPALCIQWGPVSDVGIMTRMPSNIEKTFGVKSQPIRSCLNVLDIFLNQSETIVTSFITGDKNTDKQNTPGLVDAIANILGIQDMTSISLYSTLPELGMDSISGMEIKQTLEQHHDVFLSPKEIMSLTFAQLENIQKSGNKANTNVRSKNLIT